jgi:hypothetical protein
MGPLHADPLSGKTTFYFVDMLDENLPRESMYEMLPLISTLPPTKSNDSYYPPKLFDGFSVNMDQLEVWITYWAFDMLDNLDEFEDEFSDILDGLRILLPNPLAIVEVYEYTGNETINISGDVVYTIYTSSKITSKNSQNDQMKVSLYALSGSLPFPVEIANGSIDISMGFLEHIVPQTVTLHVNDYKLKKDASLIFSVELIPGNKTITQSLLDNTSFLRKTVEKIYGLVKTLADLLDDPKLEDIIYFIDEIQNITSELNISSQLVAEALNSMISSSFVYASQTYPSSVTVPFMTGDSSRSDYLTYYLHSGASMDSTSPSSSEQSSFSLVDEIGVWSGPALSRSKILSNVSAFIYIEYMDYRFFKDPLTVEATLLSNGKELATTTQELSRSTPIMTSLNAYQFSFQNLSADTELLYGTTLKLQLSILGAPNGTSMIGRDVSIYYDAAQYRSFLSFKLSETDHLSVTGSSEPSDGKILPGEHVIYTVDVRGELADTITASVQTDSFNAEEQKQWKIDLSPSMFSIGNNETKSVTVTITSLNTTLGAYDAEPLNVILDFIGLTGVTNIPLYATVSKDVVTYDFIMIAPNGKEIVHGTNETYQFKVTNNNTGMYPDGYIFTVVQGAFNVTVFPLTVNDVSYQQTVTVNVTVDVTSKTDLKKDSFTFKVISKGNGLEKTMMINSTIIGASFTENIIDSFASFADQLGLTGIFGSYAPYFIIAILFIVIFFILILMVFIFTTKFVDIICADRIKEIYPNEHATFELSIRNPTKKTRAYALDVELSENGQKWQTNLDKTNLLIPAKESRIVSVTVASGDALDADDWTKVTVYVTPEGRKACHSIDLLTSVKDGAVDISIDNVLHWPGRFEPDQKIHTSFKLHNNGYVQAKNVHVRLYINGEEKNKVEDVVIPAGGYADITLPWIADKGKNELQIIVT